MSSKRGQVQRITAENADEAPSGSSASTIVQHVTQKLSQTTAAASRLATRVAPYASMALDYAWYAGTTALILTIPVLIEIQRETTVMVMQRQREQEMAQIQEQAKMQHGGFVEQMKGLGALVSGSAPGQQ